MSILVYSIASGEDPQKNFIELTKNDGYIYWDNAKFKTSSNGDNVFITNVSKGNWYFTRLVNNNIPINRDHENDCITFVDDDYTFKVPDSNRWGNFVKLEILEKIEKVFLPYKNTGAGCSTFMKNDGANGEIRIKQLLNVFNGESTPEAVSLLNNLLNKTPVNKMFKYYLKKVSHQDVTRTTVINNKAALKFFGASLINRDDTVTISINYLKDKITENNVVISKKQDIRIFIDRDRFVEGDILLFTSKGGNIFDLEVVKTNDDRYQNYLSSLNNNYLLSNTLPVKNPTLTDLFDQKNLNKNLMNYPLNQILYGPPGTGKTFSTITKALDIIGVEYESYEEAQELFQNELGKRIEFVTMHQSFSYEDFVQGLKPLKPKGNEGITFDYKNGVFKEICKRAEEFRTGDSSSDIKPLSNRDICKIAFFLAKYNGKRKDEKKANEFLGYESDNNAFIGIGEKINENPNSIKNHRDKFDFMFHDREGYTARNGWTPRNDDGVLDNTTKWPYREIYDEINNKSFEEVGEIVNVLMNNKLKSVEEFHNNDNFVIILDEINRANISRVFGELIALIEKDKRDGKLTATLPSGERFAVPSNLYIIGTMNTADKSIALVDIALRRRFEFTALYPDTEILKNVLEENNFNADDVIQRVNILTRLNRIIRSKKSVDFEIGHSYFMEDDDLINILNKQVLPLLNEYFMYDLRKVKDIIEKTQKDREGRAIPKPGIVFSKKVWEDRGLLKVESINLTEEHTEQVETEETPVEA